MNYSGGALGNVSGALGITDSGKSERALSAMTKGQNAANRQLDQDTSRQFGMLSDAMDGRSLAQNLDSYDESMKSYRNQNEQAGDLAWQQRNAGDSQNVQNYLNPQMDMMLSNTMQRVQGGAGAALQSSAATKSAANAVSQQAGNLWQQAFNNAMSDSQNNLNVTKSYQDNALAGTQMAGAQLAADNAPAEDYLQLANDKAMQRYAANVGITQAQGQVAGHDQSLLGGILGGG